MQLIDRVAFWDNRVIDNVSNSIYSRFDIWLTNHPLIHWLVNHSLIGFVIGLVAIVLVIRLFVTIYRTIASTIDRMWLWILRSPFLLLKFLFGWEVKSKIDSANTLANTTITNYEVTNSPELLQDILLRLEHLQQQQNEIIRDLALLKQQTSGNKATKIEPNLQLVIKELPRSIIEKE